MFIVVLVYISVFDPADKLVGLKVPTFIVIWILFLLSIFIERREVTIPKNLLLYIILFTFVCPLYALYVTNIRYGSLVSISELIQAYKPYLFLTLAIVLCARNIDLISVLSKAILLVSCCVLALYLVVLREPSLFSFWYQWGNQYGIFTFTLRHYGPWELSAIYVHSIPLSVVAVGYYTRQIQLSNKRRRVLSLFKMIIVVLAMILAGSRNSIFMAILVPLMIWFWYSPKRKLAFAKLFIILGAIGVVGKDILIAMFSSGEASNIVKIGHAKDLVELLSQPSIFLFGQGLGSKFFASAIQRETSVVELSFIDLLRKYGIILWIAYLLMFLIPLRRLFDSKYREGHYIFLAYLGYLIMSFNNPFIFSSSGMLVLSIVLHKYYETSLISNSPI